MIRFDAPEPVDDSASHEIAAIAAFGATLVPTDVLDLLTVLDGLGATLVLSASGAVAIEAAGPIPLALSAQTQTDPLVLAAVLGRRTGHVFAACTTCGEISMIRASWKRVEQIAAGPKTNWPACRMTPGCHGRHVPNATELDLVVQRTQPTLPRAAAAGGKGRLFGPRIPWPTDAVTT